jgi:hypothetical protein
VKPLIRRSDLTDPPRYYLLTRYRIDGDTLIAFTKYDVTDQIEALLSGPVIPDPMQPMYDEQDAATIEEDRRFEQYRDDEIAARHTGGD